MASPLLPADWDHSSGDRAAMRWRGTGSKGHEAGFLRRLARHTGGNTLAMMAVAMIPLSALAGSAIDMARLYVVKVRLQQACDAGVLAGRKFMSDSNATTLDSKATKQANAFFKNNFRSGWMNIAQPAVFTPSKTSDNRVAGTASVIVPMTIMKMFKAADVTLSVSCQARYDIADTDVVFVLDTTGSMACLPADSETTCSSYVNAAGNTSYSRPSGSSTNVTAGYAGTTGYAVPEKAGSRIAALRQAVTDFYDTMDTNKQATTNVRYGFVTYSSSVNAGAAVMAASNSYMVGGGGSSSTVSYQSRHVTGDYTISTGTITYSTMSQTNCTTTVTRAPAATSTQAYTYYPNGSSAGTANVTTRKWNSSKGCGTGTDKVGPVWTYEQWPQNVGSFLTAASVQNPASVVTSNSVWLGCLEERTTTAGASVFDNDHLPADLDPDLVPNSDATRWRAMWPDVEYQRNNIVNYYGYLYNLGKTTAAITTNGDNETAAPNMNTTTKQQSGNTACGKPVQRVRTMTKSEVAAYVNGVDFVPLGGTYHDTGMIWGTRLLSRSGIFAADNKAWPGRGLPKQVVVFLTDGDMSPSQTSYGMYGMEYWDRRVTDGDFTNQKDYHNKRFLAECAKAQSMGVDVWTVSIAPDVTNELKACANSPAQALATTDGTGLSDVFKQIAKQVARLRLSQ